VAPRFSLHIEKCPASDSFYHWYKKLVLAGAREHSLPVGYVEAIETVESVNDPDEARCARERMVLENKG